MENKPFADDCAEPFDEDLIELLEDDAVLTSVIRERNNDNGNDE
jgi:hypothetical protein